VPVSVPRAGTASEARAAWLLLAPGLTIIAGFFFLPIATALVLSFTDFDIYALGDPANVRWVALDNYAHLLGDRVFWLALGNVGYFSLLGVPLTLAAALAAALLVNSRLLRCKGLARTVFFAPWVTTLVAVAIVFKYLLHTRYGLLNRGLELVGLQPVDWLGDPRWALPAIVLLSVWKNFGYGMILFVAGLQAIPESLYEAARLDGAGRWQQVRHVTLPVLWPTLLFVGLITTLGYLQLFAEPYVMTAGGPLNRTLSVVLLMYKEGFRWWHMGYAAAIAFALFAVSLAVTALHGRLEKRYGT